jgi:small subunit ribosomal protein S21
MISLSQVDIRKDESFEGALRRFKKKIEQEGILRELRDRKHYEKPSERKRKKMRRTKQL